MDLTTTFNKYKNLLTGVLVLVLVTGASLAIYDHFIVSKTRPDVVDNTVVIPPKGDVVITAPTQVSVGQLARLDVTKSTSKTFKWQVLPKTDNFVVYDDGQRAVFSAPSPGEYTFIVAGAGGPNNIDIQYKVVKVTGNGPTPGPTPGPNNPSVSDLSDQVLDWAKTVNSPNAKAEAAKLADAFDGVKGRIISGDLKTASDIIEAQKTANRTALGDSLTAWVPFLEKIQTDLKSRAMAGTMVTPEQHTPIWGEIVEGLKLASK